MKTLQSQMAKTFETSYRAVTFLVVIVVIA